MRAVVYRRSGPRQVRPLCSQAAPVQATTHTATDIAVDARDARNAAVTVESPLAGAGLSETQLKQNSVLVNRLKGKLILAPLTK